MAAPLSHQVPPLAPQQPPPPVLVGVASAAGPAAGAGHGWRPSFTQGILLGQASMVFLAVVFLRFVVFEDPTAAQEAMEQRRKERRKRKKKGLGLVDGDEEEDEGRNGKKKGRKGKGKASPDLSSLPPSAASLLSSLSYDLTSHPSESLDWLNVLLAQLLSSYRSLASSHSSGGARELVEEALNKKTGGGEGEMGVVGIDYVEVEEVELGEGYPTLSAARVRPSGVGGEGARVELDLDYSDRVSLSVSTRVVMNFPRPRFAILPVSLSLTLERFSGTLTVELPHPSSSSTTSATDAHGHPHAHAHPTLHLSLHPDFDLVLRTSSLLGSRAKLQDVPKVEQLLAARIRAAIQDRVVWPGRVEVALPGVAPHKHHHHHSSSHTAEPSAGEDGEELLTPPPLDSPSLSSPPSPTPQNAPLSSLQPPLFSRNPTTSSFATTSSSRTPETPSVDLSAPSGPSIALHPHIRRPLEATPVGEGVGGAPRGGGGGRRAPSPTESLPGYFPPASGAGGGGRRGSAQSGMTGTTALTGASLAAAAAAAAAAAGQGVSGSGRKAGLGGAGGMRHRPGVGAGAGGVGLAAVGGR
ncbi:hypothetical protein JCM8547_004622 [Rhodosporidiobolus lusitaniae]